MSSNFPTPSRRTTEPLLKLATRYPQVPAAISRPSWPTGRPNVLRTDGQATPLTPSGSPRLMNATKAMSMRDMRGRASIAAMIDRHVARVSLARETAGTKSNTRNALRCGYWGPLALR
jgi:hypothetical protein